MYNNLTTYFYQNVLPAYDECIASKRDLTTGVNKDLRLAETSAKVLYHLREFIPKGQRPSVKQLSTLCPDFRLLKDVANATKHWELDPKRNPDRVVDSAADVFERITPY